MIEVPRKTSPSHRPRAAGEEARLPQGAEAAFTGQRKGLRKVHQGEAGCPGSQAKEAMPKSLPEGLSLEGPGGLGKGGFSPLGARVAAESKYGYDLTGRAAWAWIQDNSIQSK